MGRYVAVILPGLFRGTEASPVAIALSSEFFDGRLRLQKLVPGGAKSFYEPDMLTDKDNLLRRLHALRSEHRDLDTVIARLTEHGPTDQLQIQRLKKRKLGLKDEIAWLESRLIPDRTA
jgi:hypothetical protein